MITHCPICRYSLEGLPEKHRCPACGFEYDKAAVDFRPRNPWLSAVVGGLLLIVCMLAFIVFAYVPIGPFGSIMLAVLVGVVVWARLDSARKSRVLISSDCVLLLENKRVDQVKWSRWDGSLRFLAGTSMEHWMQAGGLYSTRALKRMAPLIQQQIDRRKLANDLARPPGADS